MISYVYKSGQTDTLHTHLYPCILFLNKGYLHYPCSLLLGDPNPNLLLNLVFLYKLTIHRKQSLQYLVTEPRKCHSIICFQQLHWTPEWPFLLYDWHQYNQHSFSDTVTMFQQLTVSFSLIISNNIIVNQPSFLSIFLPLTTSRKTGPNMLNFMMCSLFLQFSF